jgi:hypothetical protein
MRDTDTRARKKAPGYQTRPLADLESFRRFNLTRQGPYFTNRFSTACLLAREAALEAKP